MRPSRRPLIATLIFLMALCAPLAVHLVSPKGRVMDDSLRVTENRARAEFPSLMSAQQNWPAYPGAIEAWMKDHMGLRAPLIRLDVTARTKLRLSNRLKAVRGSEGWLFSTLDGALEMHQGLRPYSERETREWLDAAAAIKARAEANGAAFAVFIAPNKHSIYARYLTDYPVRVTGERAAQTLAREAPRRGITLVYPNEELLQLSYDTQVFYRTDTHWTGRGAYAGYRALLDGLPDTQLSIVPLTQEGLEADVSTERIGDLNGLLGIANPSPETITEIRVAKPQAFNSVELPDYDWRAFKADRQIMPNGTGPRVLVYGDSFFKGMAPFMRESFSEVTFIHYRLGNPPLRAIDEGEYDLVILEIVERTLSAPLVPDTE